MTPVDPLSSLPRVTIALPTLNRVDYLQLALESALCQTYGNVEVIVSNNASTDATAAYLAACTDLRLFVLHQAEVLSMTENWNACLAAATGEYFLLLSDDDLLEPDGVRQMMAAYGEAPDAGIVYCNGCIIDSAGKMTRRFRPSPLREDAHSLILHFFKGQRDLWFCGVLLRMVDLRPGFPVSYKVACDAATWIRVVIRRGYAVFVPALLVRYRLHASLSSATRQEIWRAEYKQLYELVLAEDRQAGSIDPTFRKQLLSAFQIIDRSLLLASIKAAFGENKLRLLLAYTKHFPSFASFRGMIQLSRELALLFLPQRFTDRLRKLPNGSAPAA